MTDVQKLIIELAPKAADALKDIIQLDEPDGLTMLNRTTAINRAIMVYAAILRHQKEGGEVFFRDKDSTKMDRVHWE